MRTRKEIEKEVIEPETVLKWRRDEVILEVLLDIRDSLTEKKLPEPVTFGPISGSHNPFKPEPEKTAESEWETRVRGLWQRTNSQSDWIDLINDILSSHTEQKKKKLIEKIEKLPRYIYQEEVINLIKEL